MDPGFKGWPEVAKRLGNLASSAEMELNDGQRASLIAIADRISLNGMIIADEVGMGKTRIAVAVAKCVIDAGGRVAILVPPGLGYQWRDELRGAGIDTPPLLRSLRQFLQAWENKESPKPWFEQSALLISHAFTNWRLGEHSAVWRWALLPELYARWEKGTSAQLARDYHGSALLNDARVHNAAESIIGAVRACSADHPCRRLMQALADETPWSSASVADEYRRNAQLRPWLERAVGLGLGVFDLVITDEAHKSRGQGSGLNRLLKHIVLCSGNARHFAMTATPVELDAQQWMQILERIGVDGASASDAMSTYAEAVRKVRQCPSDESARSAYKVASIAFKKALTPYLLRRDKRESSSVLAFQTRSSERFYAYRQESEILVKTAHLPEAWKQAVCAAEALSFVTQQADDSISKRLRLTLGNGHGVAALIDQIHRHEVDDKKQDEDDGILPSSGTEEGAEPSLHDKRAQRAEWWQKVMIQASQGNTSGDVALYDHPAILATITAIEEVCQRGEKVLVFGRFTRPLRALVELLNARAMLRSVDAQQPWPHSKVHEREWNAVAAAHRQLRRSGPMNSRDLDQVLDEQYKRLEEQRRTIREKLIGYIETGLDQMPARASTRVKALFGSFKDAVKHESGGHGNSLAVVARAIQTLVGTSEEVPRAHEFARAFVDLVEAASDRDVGDANGDETLDTAEAADLWVSLEARLHDEYSQTESGFARLMYGDTKPETRRFLQLAFNRRHSHPKVLVAQSIVGREGLNLHRACRTVILLHPEWNPGVVEQQIGRVDRIGSLWEERLKEALDNSVPASELPRIEICPVVFQGTYDERNWQVLRDRWDDLRAQLHGIVISPRIAEKYIDDAEMVAEINDAAPNFSPLSPPR
ncbi:helicase-related protein, partial [Castellaniella caeni]